MELIDRGALKDKLCEHCDAPHIRNCTKDECRDMLCSAMDAINDAQTIDAVPVVRCKDCKHWFNNVAGYTGDEIGHCECANWMVGENGYCVYGERGEGKCD